jgi:hypothetical protein
MRSYSRMKKSKTAAEASASEPCDDAYRTAVASVARALVADMFDHVQICSRRECRTAGRCQSGFCSVSMERESALVFAGMMAFHDVFCHEVFAGAPAEPAS